MKYLTDYETKAAYDAVKKDLPKPQIALVRDSYNVHFTPNKVGPEYDKEYFTIIAKEDGTVTFKYGVSAIPPAVNPTRSGLKNASLPFTSISYSLNDGAWETTEYNQQEGNVIEISVSSGDKVRWKGENHTLSILNDDGNPLYMSNFTSDCLVDVEGNIMSLLFGDEFIGETSLEGRDGAFGALFCDMNLVILRVVSAENLILLATALSKLCYANMFFNCTSLTKTPQLPATTLAERCYESMFQGCTSLTEAPQLLATTLAFGCCYQMFYNCGSLTEAPELLATTLADYCYGNMFLKCIKLKYIKCLATDISASDCTYNWVGGVASSGTFIRDANTSWTKGVNGIPGGWDVEPPLDNIGR